MIKLFFAGISIAALITISDSHTAAIPFSFSDIPEPATMLLLGIGLIGFSVGGRKTFFRKG